MRHSVPVHGTTAGMDEAKPLHLTDEQIDLLAKALDGTGPLHLTDEQIDILANICVMMVMLKGMEWYLDVVKEAIRKLKELEELENDQKI